MNNPSNQHAIVIGGSLAGLLAARVLSDYYDHVTLLERDPVHDRPETRKGQPQTRHPHGLLTGGLKVLNRFFPCLETELVEKGAIIADQGLATRFFFAGSYRTPFESGLQGILLSRPLLEWQIRRRVADLPNVTLCDESRAEKLVTTPDRSRVTGVVIEQRNVGKRKETLTADLVVDAAGRGSPAPKWLESIGYSQLEESVIKIDVSYTTRLYRRRPGDLGGAYVMITLPEPPVTQRGGFMLAQEDNRWMLTLAGWGGDHSPGDESGFVEFARSLPAPDIYELITRNEPLSDPVVYKFPTNLRRHYEKMSRFPEGYLVLGDAVCSFNPVYGQGMSSAALQAAELDKVLSEQKEHVYSQGIWKRYFKGVAKVVDYPWQAALGSDFNYPTTEGEKAPGTDLINAYMTRIVKISNHDPVVCLAFLKVINLLVPFTSLFHPRIMWRVLREGVSNTENVRGKLASQETLE